MARFSKRSIAATLTFFPAAFLTARLYSFPLPSLMNASIAYLNLSYLTTPVATLFLVPIATSLFVHRILSPRLANLAQSFSLSFIFSLGLALTGMLRPSKVLSFFYVPISTSFATSSYHLPPWDPSLALVALGGLVPNILAWRGLAKDRATPKKRGKWDIPTGGKIDKKLIFGSALFGIGWGESQVPKPCFRSRLETNSSTSNRADGNLSRTSARCTWIWFRRSRTFSFRSCFRRRRLWY
jgi:hypothetical protein